MTKIAYLAIIMSMTSASSSYCLVGLLRHVGTESTGRLSEWYDNWQTERDYKRIILKPITKIIQEEAKNKELQVDAEIAELGNIDINDLFDPNREVYTSVYSNDNQKENLRKYYKKQRLERKKEAFHNISTNSNTYLEDRDRYWKEGRKMNKILHANQQKHRELLEQFNKMHPENKRPIRTILGDKVERNNKIKKELSKKLTSAEEYDELLSQVQ